MANALPYLVPTVAVLLGVLFTRQDIIALRAEIIELRNSIHRDMIGLHERVATVEAKQER